MHLCGSTEGKSSLFTDDDNNTCLWEHYLGAKGAADSWFDKRKTHLNLGDFVRDLCSVDKDQFKPAFR